MISQKEKYISSFFVDDSLTKKASLNSLALVLDYGARILVALFLTPWMVMGLGNYFFGVWQILNRLVGYMTPTSGKPTEVLKSAIANQQNSVEYESKRSYVGATILLWFMFLPLIGIVGSVTTWFVPYWIHSPETYFGVVRVTTALLVINLAAISITNIPQSVLEGENLGYKRIGLSVLLIISSGGLTWLFLRLDYGIIGVASVALITTLCAGLLYYFITCRFIGWFGIARPSRNELKHFAGLSWWFLSWNMFMNLMITMDVVLLGLFGPIEIVTSYTLMKYIPETIVGIVATLVFGTIPGLGGIIGSGDLERASYVREELMLITWLIVTVLGTSIIIWNRSFIELWVGGDYYTGILPNLLIILLAIQFVFIRIDSYIIDVTLDLKGKILTGFISISLSLLAAVALLKYFDLGVIGLCIGILAGRSVMSLGFPILVSRLLKTSFLTQFKEALRPGLVTLVMFSLACWCASKIPFDAFSGVKGWFVFICLVGLTSGLLLLAVFIMGLSNFQKERMGNRIRALILRMK